MKKRFMMSLVVVGLLAAMLPGVATARGGASATATTFEILALDYVWDGRLAGSPTSDYVWDGRLAGSPTSDYVWDGRLAGSPTSDYAWGGR